MRKLLGRLSVATLAALAWLAIVAVAAPVANADLCLGGRTWNPDTRMCDPPPPIPAWYQAPPAYAQPWAPAWAPPPPPAPPWAELLRLKPVWDPKLNTWNWIYIR